MKEAFCRVTQHYMDCFQNTRNECDCPHNAIIKELQRKLKQQQERIEDLEGENDHLLKEIKGYEDYICNQVEQMKKLSYYIDFLGPDSAKHHDENPRTVNDNHCKYPQFPPEVNQYEAKLFREQENNKALLELIQSEKRSRQNTEETLSQTVRMCEDLLHRNETLKRQNDICAAQCEELKILRTKAQRADELECEKRSLVSKIRDCMCHMNNQDATINSLTHDMQNKTKDHSQRETQLNAVLEEMKNQIAENDRQLAENRKQLEQLSMEKMCMSAQVEELERQVGDYECAMSLKDDNNKVLLRTIEQEKAEKLKLRNALDKISKIQDSLSEMLAQARCTIKSITQKLEEYDIERLETQRDTQVKISELKGRLVIANSTIQNLRGNLDQMKRVMDKNVALRTLSSQLHQSANNQVTQLQDANEDLSKESQKLAEMYNYLKDVLYEKDKTFDELRNQLVRLKEQLDSEQKLRADAEMALESATSAGDSEVANLKNVIECLRREINRLNYETKYLMKTTPVGKMKTRIEKLEEENVHLRNEVKSLGDYLQAVLPGYVDPQKLAKMKQQLQDLNAEVKQQKQEVDKQKKLRLEAVQNIKTKLAQQEAQNKRLEEYVKENAGLRPKRPNLQTVVIVEKKSRDDGEPKYRCLYAAGGEKKKEEGTQQSESGQVQICNILKKIEQIVKQEKDPKTTSTLKEQLDRITKLLEDPKLLSKLQPEESETRVIKKMKHSDPELFMTASEIEMLQQKNKMLEDEVQRLKKGMQSKPPPKENAEFQNERDQLLGEIDSQKKEIAYLLSKINTGPGASTDNEELVRLKQENKKLENMLHDAKRQLKTLENPPEKAEPERIVEQLRIALQMEQKRVGELQEIWDQCEEKIETLQKKVAELTNENAKLRAVGAELKEQTKQPVNLLYKQHLKNLSKEMDIWKDDINDTIRDIEKTITGNSNEDIEDAKLSEALKQIADLQQKLSEAVDTKMVTTNHTMQEKQIEELEKQVNALETENAVLKDEHRTLSQAMDQVKKKVVLRPLAQSGTDLLRDEHIEELERKLRQYERRNNNLQAEVERLRFHGMSISNVTAEFPDERKMEDLKKTIRQLQEENDYLKGKVQKSSSMELSPTTDSSNDSRVKELEARLKQWQSNYDNDIGRLKAQIEAFKDLPQGAEQYAAKIGQLESKLQEYQKRNELLEKNNALLEAENQQFNEISNYDDRNLNSNDIENHKYRELVDHLRTLERRNETLKTRTVQLELDNGQLREDLERIMGKEYKAFEKEMGRLRDLEKQMTRCQEKYQNLKKRLIKLEIENRNLKKEYISTLIEKEKLILQSHEQTKRLRETNKLLRKTQDKKQSLTSRVIKLQVENENLKQQLDSVISKELEEHMEKIKDTDEILEERNKALQYENDQLREMLQKLGESADSPESTLPPEIQQFLMEPRTDDLKHKVIQLEIENKNLRRQLEGIKSQDVESLEGDIVDRRVAECLTDIRQIDDDQKLQMKTLELEIENEYLKNELESREKFGSDPSAREKRIGELEDEMHKLSDTNENLKRVTIELELDNEYLKKEVDRLSKAQENLQTDTIDRNLEKQNHALKIKIENLEAENRKLRQNLETLGQVQISLESHAQQKTLSEIERLLQEYRDFQTGGLPHIDKNGVVSYIDDVELRLQLWRNEYEPQILELRRDLEALVGKETNYITRLEKQLGDNRGRVNQLEIENKNLRVALEVLLKEKDIIKNVKLVKEVEDQLQKYRETESLRRMTEADERRIIDLEESLKDCQNANRLLRAAQTSLNSHLQDQRIRDLETELRRLRVSFKNEQRQREKKSAARRGSDSSDSSQAKEDIQQLKSSNMAINRDLDQLRNEKSALEGEFHFQLRTWQKEKEELTHEIERLSKLNDLQQRVKSDLEKQLQHLRNSTSDMILAGKMSKDRTVSFEDDEVVKEKLLECERESENLKEEYLKLHEEYGEKLKRIQELEEQLKKCRDMNKHLKTELGMSPSLSTSDNNSERKNNSADADQTKDDQGHKSSAPNEDKPTEQELKEVQEYDNLKAKLEELKEVESHLEENRQEVETLRHDFDKLQQENTKLQQEVKKIIELEASLKDSLSKYKAAKIKLDKLEKDKSVIRARKADRRIIELEGQLIETRTENEINKTKVEYLRREIATHDAIEKENKHLKDELNRLTQITRLYDEENKKMKNQVNELTQEKHEFAKRNDCQKNEIGELKKHRSKLTQENDDQQKEIGRLQKEIHRLTRRNDTQEKEIGELQCQIELGGGEYSAVTKELEERTRENQQLKLVISDLEQQIRQKKLELDEIQAEKSEKRVRRLEETLCKYQDNNEHLKVKIDQLENEKSNLMMELTTCFGEESETLGTVPPLKKNLEIILEKYQNTDQNWKEKAMQTSLQSKRIKGLEHQVRQCQIENERLKLVTIQLEAEINCLKRDISNVRSEIVPTQRTSREENTFEEIESELNQQKTKWKTIVSKLTQEYEENISLLKRRLQPFAPTLLSENPWMVGSTQPTLLPTAFTAMPFMCQPMMPYLSPPQTYYDAKPADSLQEMSDMVNKIQKTLTKSKRVLDSELVRAIAHKESRCDDEEEQEQSSFPYEAEAATMEAIPRYSDIDENIAQLTKQFMKQQETKDRIEKLHSDIQETMKGLREVCQARKSERRFFIDNDQPSTSTVAEIELGQRDYKVVRRHSNLDPQFNIVHKAESSGNRKCSHSKPANTQSSARKDVEKKSSNSSKI